MFDGPPNPQPLPSIETLENELTTLWSQITAATHRWLMLLAEFDAREGHAGIGIKSCAHWLNWRCGISPGAAREKVRTARALQSLPRLGAAMARGQLSYSKVRALTRIATPDNEQYLLDLGLSGTAHHIEQTVRRHRRADRAEELTDANTRHESRSLHYFHDTDGSLVINARLSPEQGALIINALKAATDSLRQSERSAENVPAGTWVPESVSLETRGTESTSSAVNVSDTTTQNVPAGTSQSVSSETRGTESTSSDERTFPQLRADALTLMAETLLAHGARGLSPGDRHQVVVHIDADVLLDETSSGRCELEDGPALPPETVRRLLCDSSILTMTSSTDGHAHNSFDIGRKTRAIPPAMRRALQSRDAGCRFPGCTQRHHVDAHHIHHWANGGPTRLNNLVLLCRTHHRLVHEEGFRVKGTAPHLTFHTPAGALIPATPRPPIANAPIPRTPAMHAITPHTLTPHWMGERPDYNQLLNDLHQHGRTPNPRAPVQSHAVSPD